MKKYAKILVLLLSVALAIGATLMVVGAADETVEYTYDLAGAVAAAEEGSTVTLTGNAKVDSAITVDKNLTIDLGGYTLASTVAKLFTVENSVSLEISGTGNIELAGMLFYSSTTANSPSLSVNGDKDGITINHTATADSHIISVKAGNYSFKNADVYSQAKTGAVSSGIFEGVYTTTAKITMSFDNCNVEALSYGADRFFLITIGGNGSHISIKDSVMRGNDHGIFAGHVVGLDENGNASEAVEIMSIDNSVLKFAPAIEETGGTLWGLFLQKHNWAKAGAIGVVNVKNNSTLQVAGRAVYGEFASVDEVTCKVVFDNSTVNSVGTNYLTSVSDNEYAFRFIDVELKNGSRVGTLRHAINQNSGGDVSASVGTRTNLLAATTYSNNRLSFKLPDGKYGVSDAYKWIYDPVGDPQYPYVLAEASAAEKAPYYFVNYGFEAIRVASASADPSIYNILIKGSNKKQLFADNEVFWQQNHTTDMQWDVKAGQIVRVVDDENSYVKYVVTADGSKNAASNGSIVYGTDPYLIMGGSMVYSHNKAHVRDSADGTYKRVNMAILDFDFGAENSALGWPSTSIDTQCRNGTGGSGDSTGAFAISRNGTISYNSTMYNTNPDAKLNPIGEWNHLTVVYYTDPSISVAGTADVGIAHYYLNGVYMGYTKAYSAGADSYLMGARFNFAPTASFLLGASIAFDNISFRAYSDYIGGEEDGNLSDSNATANQYVVATPAHKFINNNYGYTIGKVPTDKELSDAVTEATTRNNVVNLIADIPEAVKVAANGYVYTNGYNVEFTADSYGYETLTDANGNTVYRFSDAFNTEVEYKFYIGEDYKNYSDGLYASIKYKYGNTPEYDLVNFDATLAADGRTGTVKLQNGWITEDGKALEPLTLDMIEATKDTGVKVYPTFGEAKALTSCTKDTATGKVLSVDVSNAETRASYKALKDGETFVFLADAEFSGTYYFYTDAPTKMVDGVKTVNGVEIDNDYTADEIATMREVAQVLNVDFNGYSVIGHTTFARVSNNTVMNLYSSVPGASFASIRVNGTNVGGQRSLAIMARTDTENLTNAKSVFNAEINLGSYTDEDGNVLYKNNLAVMGGFLIEGHTGDNSCAINGNDLHIYQVASESDSVIMARFYYGDLNFKNCVIASTVNHATVSVRANGVAGEAYSPSVLLENCIIMGKNPRQTVTSADGYDKTTGTGAEASIIYDNCQIYGRLNPANAKTINAGLGTASSAFDMSRYTSSNYTAAYYNIPMRASLDENVHYIAVPKAVISGDKAILSGYLYFVESAYMAEFKAANPDVAEADIAELGLLTKAVVNKSDVVSVKYENLDGTTNTTHTYAIGGYIVPETLKNGSNDVNIPVVATGSIISGALKITADGTWAIPTAPVTEAVTVKPDGYTVAASLSGMKANLSIFADFGINVYVPIAYQANIVSAVADGRALVPMTPVDLDNDGNDDHLKFNVTRAAKDAKNNVVLTFNVSDSYNGEDYDVNASVTINVVSYANKVLALESATAADKALMYQMLTYANAAIVYAGGAADEEIKTIIGENALTDYSASIETTYDTADLSAVFAGATVDTDADLAYVLALQAGFVGTVTVKNGDSTYTFEVDESDTEIRISGMKVYNFAHDLVINAEGTIGGEAVSVTNGNYNLATFTKYHMSNEATSDVAKAFIKALYNYVMEAAAYVK